MSWLGRTVFLMTQASPEPPTRKKLRVGHRSERGGINAVRSLLERHGMVVDEVDGRSDYGRDLNVDLTRASEVTGGIIGVQVKGGASYFRHGEWVISAAPADWEYWRSSTVPIIGMIHDPATDVIRWRSITRLARSRVMLEDSYSPPAQSDALTEVAMSDVLDDCTFDTFVDQLEAYLAATADSAYLLLLDPDGSPASGSLQLLDSWTPRPTSADPPATAPSLTHRAQPDRRHSRAGARKITS